MPNKRKSKKGPPKHLPSARAARGLKTSAPGGRASSGDAKRRGKSHPGDRRANSPDRKAFGERGPLGVPFGFADTKPASAAPKRKYDPSRPHRSRGADSAHAGAAYGLPVDFGLEGAGEDGDSGESQGERKAKRELHSSELLISRLLDALTEPMSVEAAAEGLGVQPTALQRPLKDLVLRGMVVSNETREGTVYRRAQGATAVGYITRQRAGLGFMADDRSVPLMSIERNHERGAVPGDRVLVTWRPSERGARGGRGGYGGGGYDARVASIIAERPTEVTGIAEVNGAGEWILRLWGQNKPREVFLDVLAVDELKPGELVKAYLPRSEGHRGSVAEFKSVVASMDVPSQDAEAIAALYDLKTEFPPEALADIEGLGDDPEPADYEGRLDLREALIITIDPKDARDHDDAISVEHLPDGLVRLGVHIADVSRYVTPGSALHEEAWHRATSVYLPGKTIPMLPLKLSAGLCSLKEGRERLAMSCFMVFDGRGRELRREIHQSVIKVRKFLNYEQALGILEGRYSESEEVDALVRNARKLADALNEARLANGSIVLSIDRPHLVLGEKGELVEIQTERSDASHNLVEECMLAANRAVASFLIDRNCPYIGRIHPEPDGEAEAEFAEFCERLGIGAPNFEEPRRVQLFLDGIKGRDGAAAINLAVLKSMKKAVYSAQPGLHYALGFYEYTHFTSPIRRLCDTTVHQVLRQYFEEGGDFRWQDTALPFPWRDGKPADMKIKRLNGAEADHSGAMRLAMPAIARQATEREGVAQKAEMETVQLKLLRLVQERVGDQFEGTVQHISVQGVIVQLEEVWCEGTLFYADLTNDWVTPRKFWVDLETKWGPMTFRVGDRVTVVVDEVIVPNRTLRLKIPQAALAKREGKGFTFTDMRKAGGGGSGGSGSSGGSGGKSGGARSRPGSATGSSRGSSGGARGSNSGGSSGGKSYSKPGGGGKAKMLFDGHKKKGKGNSRGGSRGR